MTRYWICLAALSFGVLSQTAEDAFRLPGWLQPYPGASDRIEKGPGRSATHWYGADAESAVVISYYKQQFRHAGVAFEESFNGIGTTIRAATEQVSCILRFSETHSGTSVAVTCAPTPRTPAGRLLSDQSQLPEVAKPKSPPDAPESAATNAVRVVYEVTGTAKKVEVKFLNSAGRTEQIAVALPYSKSFDGKRGASVYLSAENMDRDGNVQVKIRVNGSVVYQASTEQAFGIVTARGDIGK